LKKLLKTLFPSLKRIDIIKDRCVGTSLGMTIGIPIVHRFATVFFYAPAIEGFQLEQTVKNTVESGAGKGLFLIEKRNKA